MGLYLPLPAAARDGRRVYYRAGPLPPPGAAADVDPDAPAADVARRAGPFLYFSSGGGGGSEEEGGGGGGGGRWFLGPTVGSAAAYVYADSGAAAPDLVGGTWMEHRQGLGWTASQVGLDEPGRGVRVSGREVEYELVGLGP
jgi:hypothetical protein